MANRKRDDDLVAYLRETLAEGIEREDKCPILFTLHIGCGAFALGLRGAVDPAEEDPCTDAR